MEVVCSSETSVATYKNISQKTTVTLVCEPATSFPVYHSQSFYKLCSWKSIVKCTEEQLLQCSGAPWTLGCVSLFG